MKELEFFLPLAIRQERCVFTLYISISCLPYTEHFAIFGFELYQSGLGYIKSDKEMSLHYIWHHRLYSLVIQGSVVLSVLSPESDVEEIFSQPWEAWRYHLLKCHHHLAQCVAYRLGALTLSSLLSSDHGSHSTPAVFAQSRAVLMTCVKGFTGPTWPRILCASLQPLSGKMKSAQAPTGCIE